MKDNLLDKVDNIILLKSILKTENILSLYSNVAVSVSGGADSDIVVDIISKCELDTKVRYVFFNTGLEYKATFEQLKQLEKKYSIEIEIVKVKNPIPKSIKGKGQPFLNKHVTEMITRLQRHNFNWKDGILEELEGRFDNCRSALQWWCNVKATGLNISQNKWLKEFLIENPPNFSISGYCCKGAKKDPSTQFIKENNIELMITGVRKAEGGTRKTAYKTCYNEKVDGVDGFYPILWYKNNDKEEYEEQFNVVHSKCYTDYGLKRTGCAGCPFGRQFEFELEVIKEHEPKLYKAAQNLFKESYEYTRKYRKFKEMMNRKMKSQLDVFDIIDKEAVIDNKLVK